MQVRDVMTQAMITESPQDSLRSAAERMWRQQTGSLIIAEAGQLIGIITERDLLRAVALGADPDKTTVDDAMTAEVYTVTPDMPLQDAAREMAARWIGTARGRRQEAPRRGQHAGRYGVFAAMASGNVRVEHEFDQWSASAGQARIEHGDLD